jgi:hypothetical protein
LREGRRHPWKAGQQLAPAQRGATLVIEAATDISLMRPFLDGFRAYHPDLAILYVDMLSTQLLGDAQARCARATMAGPVHLGGDRSSGETGQ